MHELSLSVALVQQATDIMLENAGNKILSVSLDVGALSGVSVHALKFCFPEACRGSALENCQLYINEIPLIIFCPGCQIEMNLESPYPFCPKCQNANVEIRSGKEFNLVSMEVE